MSLADAGFSAPAARRHSHRGLLAAAALVAVPTLLPILAVIWIALSGGGESWPHLVENVIPHATATTLTLCALVSVFTATMGVTSAALVAGYDFPGRRVLSWALVLPVAVPPWLAAYALAEFFTFTGPVQTALRALTGWQSARDYWFPDIRSTAGAAVVMSAVLYPYVYLSTRVVFLLQGRYLGDAARTLGASRWAAFRRVLLPVARPAIVAGVALVLMETLNDIGASEYLGVRTLTFSVYTTWLNRGSLEGATQIALLLLLLIAVILIAERQARMKLRFHSGRATQMMRKHSRERLTGRRAAVATIACLLPVAGGFMIPAFVIGGMAWRRLGRSLTPELGDALLTSFAVATATATATILSALVLVSAVRFARSRASRSAARAATLGYALPGTILGLGMLYLLTGIDNSVDALAQAWFGTRTGLLLSGTAAAVILACTVRFLALAEGNIQAGIDKLPHHIDDAARTLGHSATASLRLVVLPLLLPAIATAFVLVFVDTLKELSATILLRPFGFNTLATMVYENASRGEIEQGAVAAMIIMAVSLVPVLLLSRYLSRDEAA